MVRITSPGGGGGDDGGGGDGGGDTGDSGAGETDAPDEPPENVPQTDPDPTGGEIDDQNIGTSVGDGGRAGPLTDAPLTTETKTKTTGTELGGAELRRRKAGRSREQTQQGRGAGTGSAQVLDEDVTLDEGDEMQVGGAESRTDLYEVEDGELESNIQPETVDRAEGRDLQFLEDASRRYRRNVPGLLRRSAVMGVPPVGITDKGRPTPDVTTEDLTGDQGEGSDVIAPLPEDARGTTRESVVQGFGAATDIPGIAADAYRVGEAGAYVAGGVAEGEPLTRATAVGEEGLEAGEKTVEVAQERPVMVGSAALTGAVLGTGAYRVARAPTAAAAGRVARSARRVSSRARRARTRLETDDIGGAADADLVGGDVDPAPSISDLRSGERGMARLTGRGKRRRSRATDIDTDDLPDSIESTDPEIPEQRHTFVPERVTKDFDTKPTRGRDVERPERMQTDPLKGIDQAPDPTVQPRVPTGVPGSSAGASGSRAAALVREARQRQQQAEQSEVGQSDDLEPGSGALRGGGSVAETGLERAAQATQAEVEAGQELERGPAAAYRTDVTPATDTTPTKRGQTDTIASDRLDEAATGASRVGVLSRTGAAEDVVAGQRVGEGTASTPALDLRTQASVVGGSSTGGGSGESAGGGGGTNRPRSTDIPFNLPDSDAPGEDWPWEFGAAVDRYQFAFESPLDVGEPDLSEMLDGGD